MRVLHLLSSSGFHGAETMAAELVRQLAALGVQVDVGILDNSGGADREILQATAAAAHETVVLPCMGRFDRNTARHLRAYVQSRGIDIVHSHSYKTTFFALLARRRLAGLARVRPFAALVVTYHNWLLDTRALRLYAALDQRLARFCDAAVGVSAPIEATLRRFVPAGRLWRIGNGADLEKFCPAPPQDIAQRRAQAGAGERFLIGFVGRLVADKGIRYLFQALADLPEPAREAWHLVLIGDGPERAAIESQLAARGWRDRVTLLGTRRDVAQWYPALDAFVLPSLVEAFPMVLVEAMACGVPVIATAVGDVEQIVVQGQTGWIVPPGNVGGLRAAIEQAMALPAAARAALGAAGRQRALAEFSSRQMALRYLDVYRRVLPQRSAAAAGH